MTVIDQTQARSLVHEALSEIAPDIDPASIDDAAVLQEDLDIDSMDFLNLVVRIHERTGIEIPERDYPKLATVGGCVAYLTAVEQ